MMEAIGQKSVIHVTDEAVTATEFGMESGENSENKIFVSNIILCCDFTSRFSYY